MAADSKVHSQTLGLCDSRGAREGRELRPAILLDGLKLAACVLTDGFLERSG